MDGVAGVVGRGLGVEMVVEEGVVEGGAIEG